MRLAGEGKMSVGAKPVVTQTVGTDGEREFSGGELLAAFEHIRVSVREIENIIEDYASERFSTELAEKEFLEAYLEGPLMNASMKAAVDVALVGAAAMPDRIRKDSNFERLLHALDVSESDAGVREMKIRFAKALTEAECDSISDPALESIFRSRMAMLISAIG